MEKFNCHSLIIGGTGQFGITLSNQLNKKNKKVIITSRKKINRSLNKYTKIVQLNIYKKRQIIFLIKKYKPKYIFYFAGQSSPNISFKRKVETMRSNFLGCKNVLDSIQFEKKKIGFPKEGQNMDQ